MLVESLKSIARNGLALKLPIPLHTGDRRLVGLVMLESWMVLLNSPFPPSPTRQKKGTPRYLNKSEKGPIQPAINGNDISSQGPNLSLCVIMRREEFHELIHH